MPITELITDPTSREPPFIQKVRLALQHLVDTNQIEPIMTDTTPRTRSSSFAAVVLDLAPGESASRVRKVDGTMSVERLTDELPELRQQMRNAIAPAVKRASEQTGRTYSVEVGEMIAPKGTLYLVAVVTRTDA